MSKLESISIQNIKGIAAKTFALDLFPNKPSILVAPNGFGKSSLACAFDSLNNARIDLKDKDYYNEDSSNPPSLTVKHDGTIYEATSSKNELARNFDIHVINNTLVPKAVKRNMGGFSSVSTSLEISAVTLIDRIPAKTAFPYKQSAAKTDFGTAGKILPNLLLLLEDLEFLRLYADEIDANGFSKVKDFKRPLAAIISDINHQKGTAQQIKTWIETNVITRLENIVSLKTLADLIQRAHTCGIVDAYLFAIQLARLSQHKDFSSALEYYLYTREKNSFDQLLSSFNTTRHSIVTKESKTSSKTSLVIEFPKADAVSNGQRDILNFIAQLLRAKGKLKKQNCILIIDEIFDYLDDANLVAFQYYVTQVIEEFKQQGRNIYPMLLTHLDPAYFRHFCFSKHKLQIRYLYKDTGATPSVYLKLVKHRDDASIAESVSKHHFHYHPDEVDLESEFTSLSLRKAWGKSHNFYNTINQETIKYLDGQDYDPIAVLLSVRIKIEKLAFEKLPTNKHQELIDQHGTLKKLDYCVDQGVDIPETHFLLSLIYNDDLHWHKDKDYETPLRSKLENLTIKRLIAELFP